jgi:WD40 repeat protein
VSRDGRFLAAFDTNGLWCIANLVTLEENTCRGIPSDFATVAIGRDGREIAVGMPDGTVQVWNLADGKVSWSFRAHSNKVDALEFSPDRKRLASAARGGEVRVWDRNASQPRLNRRLGQARTTIRGADCRTPKSKGFFE